MLLRREGWQVNIKRVARIYRAEGLAIRTTTPRRRRAAAVREQLPLLTAPNQSWAMDFLHDVLADGSKIRLLTIVDMFSRESIALEVDFGFKSPQVVDILRRAVAQRGAPQRIHCDNGLEFVSLHLDQWAYWTHVKFAFSRPGRPSDNAFCESFNNRVRQELLNPNWFASLDDVRRQAAAWRIDYNTNHPQSSLGDLTLRRVCQARSETSSPSRDFRTFRGIKIGGRPQAAISDLSARKNWQTSHYASLDSRHKSGLCVTAYRSS